MRLRIITVSLNRAMQLNTHLNSFYKNIFPTFEFDHYVIYGATDEKFEEGYNKLKNLFPNIKFIKKELNKHKLKFGKILKYPRNGWWYFKYPFMRASKYNFDDILIELIQNGPDFITFTTDDSYFYKFFEIPNKIFEIILRDPKSNFFGLWQGKNLIDCPKDIKFEDGFYTWKTTNSNYSRYWRNRFSIDFNIYHRDILIKILNKIYFINPNSLEGFVNFYCEKNNYFTNGYCLEISPWVMFSLNQVQNTGKHLDVLLISTEYLNDMFLNGYELKFDFSGPSKIIDSKPDRAYLYRENEKIILYDKNED